MKRAELTCSCGASATFVDDRGTYAYPQGVPDAKGRMFLIELRSDEWLDRHSGCLRTTSAPPEKP